MKVITKKATNYKKNMTKKNSYCDPDTCRRCAHCWDPSSSPVLQHSLLLTLAAHNEREVRP
jgi:hypothetical protein